MGIGSRHGGAWGKGTAVFLAAALGFFFLQDGPSRLTALASRPPLLSFLSLHEPDSPGTNLLKQASGVQTLSSFMEGRDKTPVRAEEDPAYQAVLADAGAGRGAERIFARTAEPGAGPEGAADAGQPEVGETGAQSPAPGGEGGQGEGAVQEASGENGAAEGSVTASGEPAMAASQVRGTVYSAEQLADFEFVRDTFFYVHKSTTAYPEQLDASVLLGKDLTLPESGEPQILLFHTHGSEAFSDSEEGNADMTVVGIGNYLAQLLSEQYGIQVIHNTEVFPYSDSYSLALDMVEKTLAEHPSIQVTIDLHRDSGGHEVVDVNGKPTAPIMFFNGMCQTPDGPLENVSNPYLLDNLAFNFQMKLKAEAYYPGLTLRTFLKAYRYNQHVLPRATLIEVGTENNTFEEARNAMEPLADLLYKVLRGK